jgi:hypothetical protein
LTLSLSRQLFILIFGFGVLVAVSTGAYAEEVPKFIDTRNDAGLYSAGRLGQLAVWGDYNNDGWQDIVLSGLSMGSRNTSKRAKTSGAGNRDSVKSPKRDFLLFVSEKGESFTETGAEAGMPDIRAVAASWADYDNDGDLDLAVVTNMAGAPPVLFRNSDGGKFTDVSSQAGLKKNGSSPSRVNWVDCDNDGLVDLFQAGRGGSRLYRNQGDGTFKDVSGPAGLAAEPRTNGAVWFDFNNDGYQDLFLANDGSNIMYKNNGDGTFTDYTQKSGLAGEESWKTTSACTGDYNGDGYIDLYITNIGRSTRNALYKNNGDGTFTDVTAETGTADAGDGRTCAWIDFDADGALDIFTTNHIRPNRLFRNSGKGVFTDTAPEAGIDLPKDIFAATWADYDRDGFIDVFLNGHIGSALMKNKGNSNNSVTLKLVGDGKKSNESAIGARVKVTSPLGVQTREVSGGRGGSEQDMLPLYFGLGKDKAVDIGVSWPGGKTCSFKGVAVDKVKEYTVSEINCGISPSG